MEETKLDEELESAQVATSTGGGVAGDPSRCLPMMPRGPPRLKKFGPRSYFSSLSPRVKLAEPERYVDSLAEMRELFPGRGDHDMVPFIRAAKGNVKAAAKHYTETLEWRAQTFPIPKESCITVLKTGMFYFRGADKDGYPLCYFTLRGHNPKTRDLDECLRAVLYRIEEMAIQVGDHEWQITVVIDRVGVDRSNQDNELLRAFLRVLTERYPTKLHKCVICPVNALFRTLWTGLKYALPERARNKVYMCSDVQGLLDHIDEPQLPEHLGGQDVFDPSVGLE